MVPQIGQFSSVYRFSSFLGWDSRVSRILANEKPLFQNSPSIAPCFKMAEKESESEDRNRMERFHVPSPYPIRLTNSRNFGYDILSDEFKEFRRVLHSQLHEN